MTDVDHTLARLEADRNEVDVQIKRLNGRLSSLLPVERGVYQWLRQRRANLTTQIEEMQDK